LADRAVVVDLPRGLAAEPFLAEVARISGKPPRTLVLSGLREGDGEIIAQLMRHGIEKVVSSAAIAGALVKTGTVSADRVQTPSAASTLGDASTSIEVIPYDGIVDAGGAVVHLPQAGVLFAGPLVINGPHVALEGSHTEQWVAALGKLQALQATHVVPGFGSWATADPVSRQFQYLAELRRQVGFVISQGRSKEHLKTEVRLGGDLLVWAPYDSPQPADLEYVYGEMTVPQAPFSGLEPKRASGPQALVLYADQPHEPGYITETLPQVFAATGVTAHFTVDVRALSAENLAKVDLLVILRDGLLRPQEGAEGQSMWMTQDQQDAVVRFVDRGGAFLNLHNSMGLYPASGGYLDLVGGRYIGHGPLERFRVEVVDPNHPITRGVSDFSIADEQHTPPYDMDKVHLLLRNRSDDGAVAAAGWVYEPGKGRLCHLANGHTRESLQHPMYQQLLRNAVRWCLRMD
jgi:type 1 glutamine amidotransferase